MARDFFARSVAVFTFMPAAALRWHEAAKHALTFHLHHAGAAVAVGAVTGSGMPAQMRDLGAVALGHLPDRLARLGLDRLAIELEGDLGCHLASSALQLDLDERIFEVVGIDDVVMDAGLAEV